MCRLLRAADHEGAVVGNVEQGTVRSVVATIGGAARIEDKVHAHAPALLLLALQTGSTVGNQIVETAVEVPAIGDWHTEVGADESLLRTRSADPEATLAAVAEIVAIEDCVHVGRLQYLLDVQVLAGDGHGGVGGGAPIAQFVSAVEDVADLEAGLLQIVSYVVVIVEKVGDHAVLQTMSVPRPMEQANGVELLIARLMRTVSTKSPWKLLCTKLPPI